MIQPTTTPHPLPCQNHTLTSFSSSSWLVRVMSKSPFPLGQGGHAWLTRQLPLQAHEAGVRLPLCRWGSTWESLMPWVKFQSSSKSPRFQAKDHWCTDSCSFCYALPLHSLFNFLTTTTGFLGLSIGHLHSGVSCLRLLERLGQSLTWPDQAAAHEAKSPGSFLSISLFPGFLLSPSPNQSQLNGKTCPEPVPPITPSSLYWG